MDRDKDRRKGFRLGPQEIIDERRELQGPSWNDWERNVREHLGNDTFVLIGYDGQKTLHDWFVLRMKKKVGFPDIDSSIDEFLSRPDISGLSDDSPLIKGMAFIVNRLGKP